jgi:beta-galactosidase/beta-glucuronidase
MIDENYPRPQFVREAWKSLDGPWSYSFGTTDDPGLVPWQGWIEVPYPPESPLSGVADRGYHPVTWYQRRFDVPDEWQKQRIILHFGAVDYLAKVWLNGRYLTTHEGGHTPFSIDITDGLVEGEQILILRAEDDPLDMEKPRGKQDWEREPHLNWYPRTSGIWQPVWIEPVSKSHIASLRVVPDVSKFALGLQIGVAGPMDQTTLDVSLKLGNLVITEDSWNILGDKVCRWITLPDPGADSARRGFLWRPEHPTLFDLTLTLRRGPIVVDQVTSYAALRSVEARNNSIYLNGRPYFLQMVVDQGYWPESHMAAPSGDALRRDVELTRSLGFNGVRKYQKIEDPRYLYWADKLGLLVWAEMPSFYQYSGKAAQRMIREFIEVIERDFNHPSIIAWVPMNNSWGVADLQDAPEQQHFVQSLYHLAKSLDPTRLVIDNDGWEHLETDVFTIRDFMNEPDLYHKRYGSREALEGMAKRRPVGRDLSLNGLQPADLPVILSEFGGLHLKKSDGWGYSEVKDPEDFLTQFAALLEAVSTSALAGFCYAQLTDTFQEKTGLLTADRKPKVEPDAIASLLKGCVKQRTAAEV